MPRSFWKDLASRFGGDAPQPSQPAAPVTLADAMDDLSDALESAEPRAATTSDRTTRVDAAQAAPSPSPAKGTEHGFFDEFDWEDDSR